MAWIVFREFLERLADVLVGEVADDDLHAGFVEHLRDTEADAAGAAGDVGDFALHVA